MLRAYDKIQRIGSLNRIYPGFQKLGLFKKGSWIFDGVEKLIWLFIRECFRVG